MRDGIAVRNRRESLMSIACHSSSDAGSRFAIRPASALVGVIGLGGLLLAALLYLWLLRPQIARPLVYDEVNFALAGEAVARIGIPFPTKIPYAASFGVTVTS